MLKKCKDCGGILEKDVKSDLFWCVKCKDTKNDYDLKYKICILGKNTGRDIGRNNYINMIGEEWRKLGHEVIEIRFGELYDYIELWDMTDCFIDKKVIPLRFIDHIHSPDIIMVEQMYNRFDVSDINATVIYQHREYTHFPDIENPDILLGSYPRRLNTFEFYHPYQYSKISYCDDVFVAVEPSIFDPTQEKTIKGITMLGWATTPANFASANGIWGRMVIEDQVAFYQECVKMGYVTYINGNSFLRYKGLLEKCEAVLIDAGYVNVFGRRMFEAMASGTLCIVRVHSKENMDILKDIGLTEDMCYFIYDPRDLKHICEGWHQGVVDDKTINAYNWMLDNHTYEIRAKKILDIYEKFKAGERAKPKVMGYALHSDMKIKDGELDHISLL